MERSKNATAVCKNCGHDLKADDELRAYWGKEIKHLHAFTQNKGKPTMACLSEDCLCSEPKS